MRGLAICEVRFFSFFNLSLTYCLTVVIVCSNISEVPTQCMSSQTCGQTCSRIA